jgi:hypothetical protein
MKLTSGKKRRISKGRQSGDTSPTCPWEGDGRDLATYGRSSELSKSSSQPQEDTMSLATAKWPRVLESAQQKLLSALLGRPRERIIAEK